MKIGCKTTGMIRNRYKAKEIEVTYNVKYDDKNTADIYFASGDSRSTFVYIHGGGFVAGDKREFAGFCRYLARQGFDVISLNYSLSPLAIHPTPICETLKALEFFASSDYDINKKFILSGDSAGSFIAFATAVALTNKEFGKQISSNINFDSKQLVACVLYCGAYDIETVFQTKFPFLREYFAKYIGCKKNDFSSSLIQINPLKYLDEQFPPTFTTAGTKDKFHAQSEALTTRLVNLGIPSTFYLRKGAYHEYHSFPKSKKTQDCMREVLKFLKAQSI